MVCDLALTPEQGLFELTLKNAEVQDESFDNVVLQGMKRNIPPEVLTRLKQIWETTKEIAGEIVHIGVIIVRAIMDFLKEHPDLTIGMALGAAVSLLTLSIPFIGPLLAPLSLLLSTLYGGGIGAAYGATGTITADPLTVAFELAKAFFQMLVRIFDAIKSYWNEEVTG